MNFGIISGQRRFDFQLAGAIEIQLKRFFFLLFKNPLWRKLSGFFIARDKSPEKFRAAPI